MSNLREDVNELITNASRLAHQFSDGCYLFTNYFDRISNSVNRIMSDVGNGANLPNGPNGNISQRVYNISVPMEAVNWPQQELSINFVQIPWNYRAYYAQQPRHRHSRQHRSGTDRSRSRGSAASAAESQPQHGNEREIQNRRRRTGNNQHRGLDAQVCEPPANNGARNNAGDSVQDEEVTSTHKSNFMACLICWENALLHQPTATNCGHIFCKSCIASALRLRTKCPFCNAKIRTGSLLRIYNN